MSAALTETIPELLAEAVAAGGDREALGAVENGGIVWLSWRELADTAARRAAALRRRGVLSGDRVAHLSGNCREWILADLAIQLVGGVHVPLHDALSPQQAVEQTLHAEAKLLLTNGSASAREAASRLAGTTSTATHAELASEDQSDFTAPTLSGEDLATILYTSGTTGAPLGVMLTQRNLVANARATCEMIASNAAETRLGVLPLSHIYARTCDLYAWLCRGSRFVLAESRETFLRDCQLARPTVLNAVPYFYQRIADGVRRQFGRVEEAALRTVLGGRVKRCYCGGAPLDAETDRTFAAAGLPIMCGYGLSEASPVITMSNPENRVSGTVGQPLANLEVRLEADGEVLVRGPSVMRGYWRDEAATARAIADGWLRTGDLGEWSVEGNLRIVGRKKELIVLATGKKAAPAAVEQLLCSSPLIEQACVVGDGRKYLAALIVPSEAALGEFAGSGHAKLETALRVEIDHVMAAASHCEQIGRFAILPRGFSLERGEVTPKHSLRRNAIALAFAEEIEQLYL